MSVDPLPTSTSTLPSSKNRSVLSKFAAHLGGRNRSISEFYIQPDDPWKTYFPGDVIKGTVVLTVVRPVRITHLVICLHGYVKVFKNTVSPGEGVPDSGYVGPGRGRRGGEYFGNGFATLFEDEVVLCGDGRLKEGIYKFQFELELPPYSLPSGISFERGAIAYMITSTLTRPTTIAPTMFCHRRITVLEDIDIALFPAPKPRVITLEPVWRRAKTKAKPRELAGDQIQDSSLLDPSPTTLTGSDHRPPLSPAPSDISGSSRRSNSSQSFQITMEPSSANIASIKNSDVRSMITSTSSSEKAITATTEVLRAGVLPGDTLPVKITINHNKQVRSPQGIIVTLYRQGRIDMHPAIPIGPSEGRKKPVYEDCLPKSRTGLSGLSLGTLRMNSVFRKDLSQAIAPLIVDPVTMNTTVKTSIRIPEDSFPTITRVPGAMISFRYYVEVVVDLRGKLSQDRRLPRLNMVSTGSSYCTTGVSVADRSGPYITSGWTNTILNTDQIRREKGVVAVQFEVVVGTRDSARSLPQARAEFTPPPDHGDRMQSPRSDGEAWQTPEYQNTAQDEYRDQEYWPDSDYLGYEENHWEEHPDAADQPFCLQDQAVPPLRPSENVDEKTRLRREEEMLLPSCPPGQEDAGPSVLEASAPTSQELSEDNHWHDYQPSSPVITPSISASTPLSSALSINTIIANPSFARSGTSSPAQNDTCPHGDDKQELERRRLLMNASAPDAALADDYRMHNAGGDAPTAPVLDDEDHPPNFLPPGESLPMYRR